MTSSTHFADVNGNSYRCTIYQESDHKILLGGDSNVGLEPDLDCSGGNPVLKDSVKFCREY